MPSRKLPAKGPIAEDAERLATLGAKRPAPGKSTRPPTPKPPTTRGGRK